MPRPQSTSAHVPSRHVPWQQLSSGPQAAPRSMQVVGGRQVDTSFAQLNPWQHSNSTVHEAPAKHSSAPQLEYTIAPSKTPRHDSPSQQSLETPQASPVGMQEGVEASTHLLPSQPTDPSGASSGGQQSAAVWQSSLSSEQSFGEHVVPRQ